MTVRPRSRRGAVSSVATELHMLLLDSMLWQSKNKTHRRLRADRNRALAQRNRALAQRNSALAYTLTSGIHVAVTRPATIAIDLQPEDAHGPCASIRRVIHTERERARESERERERERVSE